ncbi:hypothetical protein V2J09_000073 [Rumex salicifolius]
MEETIAASSASSAAAPSTGALLNEEFAAAPDVFAKEIARLEREQANPLQFGADIPNMREDFDLQSHDWKVASEISAIPDEEWKATGDDFHRPYYFGSSSAMGGSDLGFSEEFGLYFKGLVVEVKNKPKLGAIGVAIFDSRNAVVFEVSKALILPETEMRDEVAVLEAFVHGLEYALRLQLSSLVYSCVDFDVDHLLNANEEPKEAKVAELINGALLLKRRFQQCNSSTPANNNNTQTVLNLARSSIEKQAGKPFIELTLIKETCPICLEEVDSETMFEITNCLHRVCNSCLQKHIEHKVRERELPRCPELDCISYLDINSCRRLLTREMCDVIDQLIKESSIPVTDKLYCPNPKCSNLMSKAEALANAGSKAEFSACEKCGTQFCIKCKSVWHANMSCDAYEKRRFLDSGSDDAKLKRLAGDEKWRQCPLCCHMVELALGCNHICCRCGHQFCYLCGNEWKEKKATCSCPLWSEDKIIIGGGANLH